MGQSLNLTEEATQRAVHILDAKYEKADLQSVLSFEILSIEILFRPQYSVKIITEDSYTVFPSRNSV
jgi:hypothetical protein